MPLLGGPPLPSSLRVCSTPGKLSAMPAWVGGVGDVLRTVLQLEHQPVVAGVERPLERLGDVAGAAAASLDVADLDAVEFHAGSCRCCSPGPMPCCSAATKREHLERGARRQTGLREVEAVGIGAAVVGLHPAGLRVDRHHRRCACRGPGPPGLGDGLLGGLLRLRVDRGGDLQALGVQRLLGDVEELQQFLGHLAFDQPVGAGGLVRGAGLKSGATVGGNTCARGQPATAHRSRPCRRAPSSSGRRRPRGPRPGPGWTAAG